MKVELYARFPKKKVLSDEEKQEIEIQKLINPDYTHESKVEHEYEQLVLDLKDVSEWIRYDSSHTQIMKYNNIMYIVRIPYEAFNELYEDVTGTQIKKVLLADFVKE